MKPEEKAEIIIYNALRPLVKEIYFNRKNKINAPIFKSSHKKIPDLLIQTLDNRFIIVEVKPSNESAKLQRGKNQLLDDYYIPYAMDKVKYSINNFVINIDHFVLLSDGMITKGHLFNNLEVLKDNLIEGNDHKQMSIMKYKIMPRYEYSRTYDLVRGMFSQLRKFREKKPELMINKPGYGIIMKDYETKEYMLFSMCYNTRWGHHYWKL